MDEQETSSNVEDGRGSRSGSGFGVGGRSIGIGTVVLALVGGLVFGVNPLTILGLLGGSAPETSTAPQAPVGTPPADDTQATARRTSTSTST